jgi:hypothetical protein
MCTGSSRGKCSQGMVLTTHTLLAPRLWMGWSYTSASPLCQHKRVMLRLLPADRVLLSCYTVLSCTWTLSLKRAIIVTFLSKMKLEEDCVLTTSIGAQTGLFTSCPIFFFFFNHNPTCFFSEPLNFYIIWLHLFLFTSNLNQFHQIWSMCAKRLTRHLVFGLLIQCLIQWCGMDSYYTKVILPLGQSPQ